MDALLAPFQSLGRKRLIALGAIGLAVFTLVLIATLALTREEMTRLYTGLDAEASGQMVAALEEMGATVRVDEDGSIWAPEADAPRLRMALAAQGLPRNGGLGYEVFDEGRSLGLTSFMQRITRTRALEGELVRSILTLDGVESARVHLVLPERDAFSRQPAKPTASVVVRTRGAASLSANQAAAIRQLVAAAAPRLSPGDVSVLDSRHGMVAGAEGGVGSAAAGDTRRQVETDLRAAVERMLNPVVGAGNIRVEIAAELVTAREVVREQTFDPRSSAVRSEQTIEQVDDTRERAETGAVTVEQNLPEPDIQEDADGSNRSSSERVEQTRNYELSSLVRERVLEPGDVKRLTAAVIVNAEAVGDGAGGVDQAALANIDTLVKAAIGFSSARGDTVEVAPMAFAEPLLPAVDQPGVVHLAVARLGEVAKWSAFGLVGLVLVLVVVRPLVKIVTRRDEAGLGRTEAEALLAAPAGEETDGEAGETDSDATLGLEAPAEGELKALPRPSVDETLDKMMDLREVEGQVRASSLQKLGRIVEEHPDEVVAIVRSWIYEEAA